MLFFRAAVAFVFIGRVVGVGIGIGIRGRECDGSITGIRIERRRMEVGMRLDKFRHGVVF